MRKSVTLEQYHESLKAQEVPQVHLASVCPMCGTVQSFQSLINAGAGKDFDSVQKYYGFSCVGRFTHMKPPPKVKGTQEGCNWTLGGLLCIRDLDVITPDGKKHPRFEVATKDQAQELMRKALTL